MKSLETDRIEDTLFSRLTQLKQAGVSVLDIRVDRGSLEQHFLQLTGRWVQ